MSRITHLVRRAPGLLALLVTCTSFNPSPSRAQTFPLSDAKDLVKCSSDAGPFEGTLQLTRDGSKVTGTWSGESGKDRSVTGTWRNGYVELSFNAEWPVDDKGATTPAMATLVGWFDGGSAAGRMKVESKADGRWTASRKP